MEKSDLFNKLEKPKPEDIHWFWVLYPEHANLDVLPELLAPEDGCPHLTGDCKCDAAYVEIHSFGIAACPQVLGYLELDQGEPRVGPAFLEPLSAVKLTCSEGHTTEHRWRSHWNTAVGLGFGAIVGVGIWAAYLHTAATKKGKKR